MCWRDTAIKEIVTDADIMTAVNRVIKFLSMKFARVLYKIDVESIAWSAAAEIFQQPPEKRTEIYMYRVAYNMASREYTKLKDVYPTDFQKESSLLLCDEDMDFSSLKLSSLDEQEMEILRLHIEEGMYQNAIAEKLGVSKATMSRMWKKIIEKLKVDNL